MSTKQVLYKSKNKTTQNKQTCTKQKFKSGSQVVRSPTRNCYYQSLSFSLLIIIITIIIIILIIIIISSSSSSSSGGGGGGSSSSSSSSILPLIIIIKSFK